MRGRTVIDVMIPEGLDRQRTYPKTVGGRIGYVRRPTLLGALVVKARASVVDNRDPQRHVQDLIALAQVGGRGAD